MYSKIIITIMVVKFLLTQSIDFLYRMIKKFVFQKIFCSDAKTGVRRTLLCGFVYAFMQSSSLDVVLIYPAY